MHFDFPRPLAEHSYQSYPKYLEDKLISDCKRSMLNAASNLGKHVLDKFYTDEAIVDVPISIDNRKGTGLTLCQELFCYYQSTQVALLIML